MCWIRGRLHFVANMFSWKPFHRRIICAVRQSARRTEIFIGLLRVHKSRLHLGLQIRTRSVDVLPLSSTAAVHFGSA
jgi:hypothetical protein